MVFSTVLFNSLLLASSARGVPSGIGSKPVRRLIDVFEAAAVSISSPNSVLNSIAGELTVPHVTGQPGDEMRFMMGLDVTDVKCRNSSFQIGINATIDQEGITKYSALYRDPSVGYGTGKTIESLIINAGDLVYMTAAANPNMISGEGIIEKVNGKSLSRNINFRPLDVPQPLCGETASWVIEIPANESGSSERLQFEAVSFLSVAANTSTKGMLYPECSNTQIHSPAGDDGVQVNINERNITFYLST